jgi:hypothetical protein
VGMRNGEVKAGSGGWGGFWVGCGLSWP